MTTLPPSLTRFETQLETAIRRSHRRRPLVLARRTALATAAVGVLALGVLSLAPGDGPSAVARAATALTAQNGSILHVVLQSSSLRIESWEQTSGSYAERQIQTRDGVQFETATVDGESQLYDPGSNTIYVEALGASGKAGAAGKAPDRSAVPRGDRYRAKIRALLDSGAAHEDGHVTVGGRDAIRITSEQPGMTLLVDAATFAPIEWREAGDGPGDVTRFPVFEELAPSSANTALLSLNAQHPGAIVDRNPADYEAAVERLSGKDLSGRKVSPAKP
jgi:hypothetical protein